MGQAQPARRRAGLLAALVVTAVSSVVMTAGAIGAVVGDGPSSTQVAAPAVGPNAAAAGSRSTDPGVEPVTDPAVPGPPADTAPTYTAPAYAARTDADQDVPGPDVAAAQDAEGRAVASPVSLVAPAIDLRLPSLDRLGVGGDGTIEVPVDPAHAGWLTASASPGTTGPAVIAGHVDSSTGPAVFARLGELAPGDEIGVGLDDGTSVTYVVTRTDSYPKTDFPTQQVYGPAPAPVLRLITCGGTFDREVRSYEDNVVVYAALLG